MSTFWSYSGTPDATRSMTMAGPSRAAGPPPAARHRKSVYPIMHSGSRSGSGPWRFWMWSARGRALALVGRNRHLRPFPRRRADPA